MISKQTFIDRRTQLRNGVNSGIIVIQGNNESSMNFPDNWYYFRQDSSFLYYCGIKEPGMCLVLDIESGRDALYGHELTLDDVIWGGPQPSLEEKASMAGIEDSFGISKLPDLIESALKQNRKIHILPTYRAEHTFNYQKWGLDQPERFVSEELIRQIIKQRNIKTKDELQEIHKASNITGKMHLTALQVARAGMKEYELMGLLNGIALSGGGDISFPIILSINGQILHNHSYNNTLTEDRMLLVDCGAETASGYAGDRTSTFPIASGFTSRQKEIYEIVLNSYQTAVDALKPGISYKEVHLMSVAVIAEGLKDLGILTGKVEDIVENGAHALFMPHGLGHMMGLDVHDMENLGEELVGYDSKIKKSTQFGLRSLRLGRELQKGFVLTVEPGIYFIPELIREWKKNGNNKEFLNYDRLADFLDFGGIRIEDDYAITESGYQLLGDPLPRTVSEIEEIRRKAVE